MAPCTIMCVSQKCIQSKIPSKYIVSRCNKCFKKYICNHAQFFFFFFYLSLQLLKNHENESFFLQVKQLKIEIFLMQSNHGILKKTSITTSSPICNHPILANQKIVSFKNKCVFFFPYYLRRNIFFIHPKCIVELEIWGIQISSYKLDIITLLYEKAHIHKTLVSFLKKHYFTLGGPENIKQNKNSPYQNLNVNSMSIDDCNGHKQECD